MRCPPPPSPRRSGSIRPGSPPCRSRGRARRDGVGLPCRRGPRVAPPEEARGDDEKVSGHMWVDLLVEDLLKRHGGPHVVNDAKTPSGHVPVGHLRGVIMHDCVARALRDAGVSAEFLYGFDDYDPMDDLPPHLPEYARYLGTPFVNIPSPDGRAPSYGHYF